MKNIPYEETDLYKIRHTAAHVLAMAAYEFDPEVKFAIGPPIENGFYYDFEFSKPVNDDDLSILEKSMRKIISNNYKVQQKFIPRQAALQKANASGQIFKEELMSDLSDADLSHYGIDWFWDLCKGPHVVSTKEIGAVKLLKLAGAYWRGDEKKPMLTRIYGTAFATQKELDEYLKMLEEAKARDHKILGVKLGLFTFSDLVGSGLPLWTPKGMLLRETLDEIVWSLRKKRGYQKVEIPHITKKELYIKSGHWEKFKDELFTVKTREGHEFALKPMNCPHHTQIFAAEPKSYRDMPVRYANTTMVYRDEQSGELAGLSRVRSITQDDAHIFCRVSQIKAEVSATWDIVNEFYAKFGFELSTRLSLSDPNNMDNYLGDRANWQMAEDTLREIAKVRKVDFSEAIGEAAFYGPKVDFIGRDSLGREWQVATIQLDFNMPKRFDLEFINEDGKKETPVMIHAAIMGSLERFIANIIEHYGGDFPAWLSPVQFVIVPVSEKLADYAKSVHSQLLESNLRSVLDDSNNTLGKRIRTAETQKVPFIIVVGEKEKLEGTLTLRSRKTNVQKTMKINELLALTELQP